MEKLFDELIYLQKQTLLTYAHRILPHLTEEDLLQPNDFPQLELNPLFRYEEGVLAGLLTAKVACLQAHKTPCFK